MSEAIKLIVDGFVSLKNREALEQMRQHRQTLRKGLQEKSGGWIDLSHSIQVLDDDLRAIEVGFERL